MIRHVGGSKIHRVEQYPLDAHKELLFGRSWSATVQFDMLADAEVSRNHAAIRIVGDDTPSFVLVDLDSSNGTFLNGRRITGETELLPADEIALGEGGPKFVFDVRPPLEHLAPRTRLSAVATRRDSRDTAPPKPVSVDDVAPAAEKRPPDRDGSHLANAVAEPPSAGRGSLRYAAIAVLVVAVLAVVYYGLWPSATAPRSASAPAVAPASIPPSISPHAPAVVTAPSPTPLPEVAGTAEAPPPAPRAAPAVVPEVPQPVPVDDQKASLPPSPAASPAATLSPAELQGVLRKYGSAIARIETNWSLREKNGKPVYLKIAICNGQVMPVYVRLPDGQSVPWLTTNGGRGDRPIGGTASSTGFIIGGEGLILTSWQAAYPRVPEQIFDTHSTVAATVPLVKEPPPKNQPSASISMCDIIGPEPQVPGPHSGGLVFDGRLPLQLGGSQVFAPYYDVRVRESSGNPRMLGASRDSQNGEGAVTLRLGNPIPGPPNVQIAPRGAAQPGNNIVVLGYSRDDPAWPHATPGTIAGIDASQDYVLDVPGVDENTEGAPIFDADGSLIAILTLGLSPDGKTAKGLPVDAVRARLESNAVSSARVAPGTTVPPPPAGR